MYNILENLTELRRDVQSFGLKVPQPIADDQLIARISTLENRITKYEWMNSSTVRLMLLLTSLFARLSEEVRVRWACSLCSLIIYP